MNVKLISITQPIDTSFCKNAEDLMVYTARVSSPQNQNNLDTGPKLLNYCAKNAHWSVFEMADMTVEIITSRAISAQIMRHKSFNFQEASARYSEVTNAETYEPRRQDIKNRQNSFDTLSGDTKDWFKNAQRDVQKYTFEKYKEALGLGIAKESARFLLPMSTTTRIYMKGNVRSWIHYFQVRLEKGTQKEHRDIAQSIWNIFKEQFPNITLALEPEPIFK